jgi:hypothetical protein
MVLIGNKIAAEINDGNTIAIGVCNGLQGSAVLNDGRWHHLALVRSSTNVKLFVDGNQEANVIIARIGNSLTTADTLLIGLERGNRRYLNGKIDEVRIWNTARTQSQLQSNMLNVVSASASNLVAYYNFDDGTVEGTNTGITILTDQTSNSNNGTLTNFALSGSTSNWMETY